MGEEVNAKCYYFYLSGETEMKDVRVLSYNPTLRKFLIEFSESQKQKFTNRLNLQFNWESLEDL